MAAAAIAIVAWGVVPLGKCWRRMGDELAPKQAALAQAQERLDRRTALLARRAGLIRQIGYVAPPATTADADGKGVADGAARTGFEAELEKTAGQCEVDLKSLVGERVRPGQSASRYEERAFRVEAEATPDALVAFLHALEKGPRLVRVDELILRQDTQKPGPAKVTLQVAAYERRAAAGGSK